MDINNIFKRDKDKRNKAKKEKSESIPFVVEQDDSDIFADSLYWVGRKISSSASWLASSATDLTYWVGEKFGNGASRTYNYWYPTKSEIQRAYEAQVDIETNAAEKLETTQKNEKSDYDEKIDAIAKIGTEQIERELDTCKKWKTAQTNKLSTTVTRKKGQAYKEDNSLKDVYEGDNYLDTNRISVLTKKMQAIAGTTASSSRIEDRASIYDDESTPQQTCSQRLKLAQAELRKLVREQQQDSYDSQMFESDESAKTGKGIVLHNGKKGQDIVLHNGVYYSKNPYTGEYEPEKPNEPNPDSSYGGVDEYLKTILLNFFLWPIPELASPNSYFWSQAKMANNWPTRVVAVLVVQSFWFYLVFILFNQLFTLAQYLKEEAQDQLEVKTYKRKQNVLDRRSKKQLDLKEKERLREKRKKARLDRITDIKKGGSQIQIPKPLSYKVSPLDPVFMIIRLQRNANSLVFMDKKLIKQPSKLKVKQILKLETFIDKLVNLSGFLVTAKLISCSDYSNNMITHSNSVHDFSTFIRDPSVSIVNENIVDPVGVVIKCGDNFLVSEKAISKNQMTEKEFNKEFGFTSKPVAKQKSLSDRYRLKRKRLAKFTPEYSSEIETTTTEEINDTSSNAKIKISISERTLY